LRRALRADARDRAYSPTMSRLLFSIALLTLLGACAASDGGTQERCTPQWPPGPCAEPGKGR
jgi:hypothetical protein